MYYGRGAEEKPEKKKKKINKKADGRKKEKYF